MIDQSLSFLDNDFQWWVLFVPVGLRQIPFQVREPLLDRSKRGRYLLEKVIEKLGL